MKIYNISTKEVEAQLNKAQEDVRRYEAERDAIMNELYSKVEGIPIPSRIKDEAWQKERARVMNKDREVSERLMNAKMTAAYLKDNLLAAAMSEYIPVFVSVWNKYAGKKYGPKTREAIWNEVKDACGYSVHAYENEYRCEISAVKIVEVGINPFNYQDLDVSIWKGKKPLEGNVIQPITVEELPDFRYKVHEDISSEIEQIRKAYAKANAAFEAAKTALDEYKALIPACGAFEEVDHVCNPLRSILR